MAKCSQVFSDIGRRCAQFSGPIRRLRLLSIFCSARVKRSTPISSSGVPPSRVYSSARGHSSLLLDLYHSPHCAGGEGSNCVGALNSLSHIIGVPRYESSAYAFDFGKVVAVLGYVYFREGCFWVFLPPS